MDGGEGFDLELNDLDAVPPFDSDNRISLHFEREGQTEIAGQTVVVFGAVEVTESGVDVHVASSMNSRSDAFGIEQLSLNIRPKGEAVRKPRATPWVTAAANLLRIRKNQAWGDRSSRTQRKTEFREARTRGNAAPFRVRWAR